jgi:hypothetical protein
MWSIFFEEIGLVPKKKSRYEIVMEMLLEIQKQQMMNKLKNEMNTVADSENSSISQSHNFNDELQFKNNRTGIITANATYSRKLFVVYDKTKNTYVVTIRKFTPTHSQPLHDKLVFTEADYNIFMSLLPYALNETKGHIGTGKNSSTILIHPKENNDGVTIEQYIGGKRYSESLTISEMKKLYFMYRNLSDFVQDYPSQTPEGQVARLYNDDEVEQMELPKQTLSQ